MQRRLVIVAGPDKGRTFVLEDGQTLTIGRGQASDTQIRYQLGTHQEEPTLGGEQVFGRPKPEPKIAPLKDLVGRTLACFRLDSIIAGGNSGMVFQAQDAVLMMLAKRPEDRYHTPADLLRDLDRIGRYANLAVD